MVRLGEVVIAYFLIGALMWAGGVIDWQEAGVGSVFVDPEGNATSTNASTGEQLEQAGGPIQQAANTVSGGGLLAVWGLVTSILAFLFWPVTVLQSVQAPSEIVVLVGGPLVVAFFMAIILTIRGA